MLAEGDSPGLRHNHCSILYKKQMVVFGGKVNSFDSCSTTYSLDLVALRWTKLDTKFNPPDLDGHCGALWGEKLIVFGGFFGGEVGKFSSSVFALDLNKLTWEVLHNSMEKLPEGSFPAPRSNAGATIIGDSMFVFGGTNID